MEGNNMDGEQPPKKVRGPYKRWLLDPTRLVPESTLRSRKKKEGERNERNDDGEGAYRQDPNDVMDGNHGLEIEGNLNRDGVEDVQAVEAELEIEGNINRDGVDRVQDVDADAAATSNNDEEVDSDTGSQKIDYVQKYGLNSSLHPSVSVSKLETLLMILFLAVRHCHTQSFVEAQISFVNTIFGADVLDVSYYIFQGVFPASKSIVKHYFCKHCENYVGSEEELQDLTETECDQCHKMVTVNNIDAGNFFVTLSLREQLRALLERPDIELVDHANRMSEGISDVFDGKIFERCRHLGLSIADILTLVINTDGMRMFDSTVNTMYPILAHINELVPGQRFKVENVLLCGLWFGRSAPTMSLFLKPFIKEVLDLSVNGVSYRQPNGELKKKFVFPLVCSCDSVAKPKVTCQKQFNGFDACPYCLHPNDTVIPGDNTKRYYDTSVTHEQRTEESVVTDMFTAHELHKKGVLKKDEAVHGFLGMSILLMFSKLLAVYPQNTFHMVWGVAIDYMHCALEGITAHLLSLYLTILNADQIKILNERIESITPPQGMTRRPRTITDKIKWKAKEFRSFLLYYALPCLEDLLPVAHFSLLKLFVNSMHILLSDCISVRAFREAKQSLALFVSGFQRLYGLANVTFNLHLLTHFSDQVYQLGPLWCYSNFIFESCNGQLAKLSRGTRSVVSEISKKFTRLQVVPGIIRNNPISDTVLEFGNSILGHKYVKHGREVNGVFITGSHSDVHVTANEKLLFDSNSIPIVNNFVRFYHRVIANGIVFYSYSYSKSKVFNDSCVMLSDGTYALIDKIVVSSTDDVMCLFIPIRIAGFIVPSIKRCSHDCYGEPTLLSFKNVSKKCVLISFETKTFICDLPNAFERD